jgi:TetR/AcrR family transcriptional regulator
MTSSSGSTTSSVPWAERAADRSPSMQRSRTRSIQQTRGIIDAARRLAAKKGGHFTTQELVKEARIALQTFYRHFAGKDQLLIALIGDVISEAAAQYEEEARGLPDPVARLHFYITATARSLDIDDEAIGPRFITAEHLRLHQLFPEEISEATRPFMELVLREIRAAEAAGLLAPTDPERDAWHVTRLTTAVYHHYAFARADESAEEIGEHLWRFCLAALGGVPEGGGRRRRAPTRQTRQTRPAKRRSG